MWYCYRLSGRYREARGMPRWLHSVAFSVATALLGAAILISPMGSYLEREFGLAWLFSLRGAVQPPPEVAVVGIDSRSGPAMGLSRLPRNWPRSLHAMVVQRLMASGASGIVFDIDFSQPKTPVDDLTLADSIAEAERVVLFERLEGRNERIVSSNAKGSWVWVEEAIPPAEPIAGAARATAPFPLPKLGKTSLQFWVFKPSADDTPTAPAVAVQLELMAHYPAWREMLERAGAPPAATPPAASLQPPGALRAYMKRLRKLFLAQPDLADRLRKVAATAALDAEARAAVQAFTALYGGPDERYTNFYGPPGTIPTIPYHEVVGEADFTTPARHVAATAARSVEGVAGRMVFVGYSDLYSPDQPDRFYTVFTSDRGIDLSGSEIMATAFGNLLTDRAVAAIDPGLAVALVVAFGLVVSHLVFWPSAYIAVPLALLAGGAYGIGALEVFTRQLLWLPMTTPLAVQLTFAVTAGLLGQYLVERRKERRVSRAIAHYLPEHLVKDLTEGRVDVSSVNRVVHGVCLATDMSGFTRISEGKSPTELARFMNDYFEAIAQALKRCEVDVTEFHADTIMCAWIGEPDDPEIRRKAVHAAIEVVRAIERFAEADPDLTLTPRVGLQDGPFYLGHTGGGGRLSYSILGDPANSAARLESLNKKLGTRILAAGSVVEGLADFALRPLGEVTVVGKSSATPVVEVFGRSAERSSETDELCRGFSESLEAFLAGRWEAAAASFSQLVRRFPEDRASALYLEISLKYAAEGASGDRPTQLAMSEK